MCPCIVNIVGNLNEFPMLKATIADMIVFSDSLRTWFVLMKDTCNGNGLNVPIKPHFNM